MDLKRLIIVFLVLGCLSVYGQSGLDTSRILELIDYEQSSFSLKNNTELLGLEISHSKKLKARSINSNIKYMDSLEVFILKENSFKKFPLKIAQLPNLKKLVLEDQNELPLEAIVEELAKLQKIEELVIPLNGIQELPTNIGKLKSLKRLDISNNNIETLPEELASLNQLAAINLNANIFWEPLEEMSKLPNSLELIKADQGFSEAEQNMIQTLFPNAQFQFEDDDSLEVEQDSIEIDSASNLIPFKPLENDTMLASSNLSFSESLMDSSVTNVGEESQAEKEDNEIQAIGKNIRVHSNAYLLYSTIFNQNDNIFQTYSRFDTTIFDERFESFDYAYTRKKIGINPFLLDSTGRFFRRTRFPNFIDIGVSRLLYPGQDPNPRRIYRKPRHKIHSRIRFEKVKRKYREKKKMCFTLDYDMRVYKELNAFNALVWVVDDIGKREFKRSFKRRNIWCDSRLSYDDGSKVFTFKMKGPSEFSEFDAYPIMKSKKTDLEKEQAGYLKRYMRYDKGLEKVRVKFNKKLAKSRGKLWGKVKSKTENNWKELRTHMSDKELDMSREEWLTYYDSIMMYEDIALANSQLDIPSFKRSIEMSGYSDVTGRRREEMVGAQFMTVDSAIMNIKNVITINIPLKTYTVYGRGVTSQVQINGFVNDGTIIVVEHRNGDFAVVDNATLREQLFDNRGVVQLIARLYKKDYSTIGQVRKENNIN